MPLAFKVVKGKGEWWENNHEVHTLAVTGRSSFGSNLYGHAKSGPMAGKPVTLDGSRASTPSRMEKSPRRNSSTIWAVDMQPPS